VVIDKSQMGIEGTPAGWRSIDAIRISAWRGGDKDTAFYISDIEAVKSPVTVVIVRGESAAAGAPEGVCFPHHKKQTVTGHGDKE
jgi:hypothetical protein